MRRKNFIAIKSDWLNASLLIFTSFLFVSRSFVSSICFLWSVHRSKWLRFYGSFVCCCCLFLALLFIDSVSLHIVFGVFHLIFASICLTYCFKCTKEVISTKSSICWESFLFLYTINFVKELHSWHHLSNNWQHQTNNHIIIPSISSTQPKSVKKFGKQFRNPHRSHQ